MLRPVLFHLVVTLAAVTVGGEHRYGISRFAVLSQFPDVACLKRVLSEVTGIESLEDLDQPDRSKLHRFRYQGQDFCAYLSVRVDASGETQFLHDRISVDEKPSEEELRQTRRVMLLVEQRLALLCGMNELTKSVHEEWVGVKRPE